MTLEVLLERLPRVRQTGRDSWIAGAPTRADKHPSVTIRALPDGRVLLHDFGGDSTADILAAIGLTFEDLFPPRAPANQVTPRERQLFNARDILSCLALEVLVVADCSRRMRSGKALPDVDHARLLRACGRISAGAEMANPGQVATELRRRLTAPEGANA